MYWPLKKNRVAQQVASRSHSRVAFSRFLCYHCLSNRKYIMESTQVLNQGLVLLVAGTAIVFIFLYLLVMMMRLTARVVPRFNHLLPDPSPKRPAARPAPAGDAIAIAIAAAVAARRS